MIGAVLVGNIVAVARETSADLILLSSHLTDITDYVFFSIVEKVVRHAGCSVLIDRRPDHAEGADVPSGRRSTALIFRRLPSPAAA